MVTVGWEPENMLPENFKTVTKGCLQFCIQVFHFDILQSRYIASSHPPVVQLLSHTFGNLVLMSRRPSLPGWHLSKVSA